MDCKGEICYLGVMYKKEIMLEGVIKARSDATDAIRMGIMQKIVRKCAQENHQYKHPTLLIMKKVEGYLG